MGGPSIYTARVAARSLRWAWSVSPCISSTRPTRGYRSRRASAPSRNSASRDSSGTADFPTFPWTRSKPPFFREAIHGGVVSHCSQHGLAFLAYSPVGGGRLNLKLPAHPVAATVASRHGITPHQAVLAWVLAQGETVFVIPGARTVSHATDSAAVAGIELTPEDLAAIDAAAFSCT